MKPSQCVKKGGWGIRFFMQSQYVRLKMYRIRNMHVANMAYCDSDFHLKGNYLADLWCLIDILGMHQNIVVFEFCLQRYS